jgi:putative ABC transport system permease protein
LEEVFQEVEAARGLQEARRWYWRQCLAAIPAYILFSLRGAMTLASKNLRITFRNIRKHKVFSFVNIAGYAVGMAGGILILLWVQNELAFDRHHPDAERVYRITGDYPVAKEFSRSAVTSAVVTPRLRADYPEIETTVRLYRENRALLSAGDVSFIENSFFFADAEVFDLFSFPWAKGDPRTALRDPQTMVLTRPAARKYFGRDDPLGKTLTLQGRGDFLITGLVENSPTASHWHFDFLASYSTFGPIEDPWIHQGWTYVRLRPGASPEALERKFKADSEKLAWFSKGLVFFLQPLREIHLRSHLSGEIEENGEIQYIYIFFVIAALVILVAAVNFINLSTARAARRAREVGLRKVVGATRRDLIRQFLGEALALSILAFGGAMLIAGAALPFFNELTGRSFALADLLALKTGLPLIGIVIAAGLGAGSYPAFLISSFQPADVFRRKENSALRKASLRKILVIGQFAVSIGLIAVTAIVGRQMTYVKAKDLGFDKSSVLQIPFGGTPLAKNFFAFKQEILKNPDILSATAAIGSPFSGGLQQSREVNGRRIEVHHLAVDPDYLRTLRLELAAGADFPPEYPPAGFPLILNETAVRAFDLKNPVGRTFPTITGKGPGTIIGVAKDFHVASLRSPIPAVILEIQPRFFRTLLVRISGQNSAAAVKFLSRKWKEFVTHMPFSYAFLDEVADGFYKDEARMGRLCAVFAGLAVLIAGLGLFGLASYAAERRTKEIGIRKVLGARVGQIVWMTARESLRLVAAANILAWPAAFFLAKQWLRRFSFQTGIGIEVFILSGLAALILGTLTIGVQSIRSAAADPVAALKDE